MLGLKTRTYPYMEEVNEGIVRQFERLPGKTGRVLDVGCGRGQLGEAIRKLGWEVWGVEQSDEACDTARGRLDNLVQTDLNNFDQVRDDIGDEQFDALIFSDVLEHVYDPQTVLENYLEFVRPGGMVLISVPNMVAWTNRLMLLLGQVRYTDTGIMDRTHIRFFTFKTAKELVRSVGCEVAYTDCTPHIVRAFLPLLKRVMNFSGKGGDNPRGLIDSPLYQFYMKAFYPAERLVALCWRTLLAFRIIVVGTKPQ